MTPTDAPTPIKERLAKLPELELLKALIQPRPTSTHPRAA